MTLSAHGQCAFLLASNGWQIKRGQAIVGRGGRGGFVAWEERRFDKEFLPNHKDLRHVRLHNIRPGVNKAV